MKEKLIYFIVILNVGIGCTFEVNDTTLDAWPQLYNTDDWARCQGAGDVYCLVDAELIGDSLILSQLRDYSAQTLKHYNRSLIHRGICVSRCGNESHPGTWTAAAQTCIDNGTSRYGLQAKVISVDLCSVNGTSETGAARAFAVPCIILVVLALLATCFDFLGEKCGKCPGNNFLMAFSLKRNWAILTYDRSNPRTEQRMKDLTCIEGIRFLGIQCVIFSHVLFINLYSYTENPDFMEKMYDNFVWKYILNSPVWLQAFFCMSGFLTAYSILIITEKSSFTWTKALLAIINRYIRLTPPALFALWFTMTWFPLLGSGPQWSWLVEREVRDCSERWWYHILYVHNYLPMGKLCMGHTWYLAADMQLHIIGIIILIISMKYRKALVPLLAFLLFAAGLAAAGVVYIEELTPIITAQAPESLRSMFANSQILPDLYLPVWMNLSGYVCGVAIAFIFYHCQLSGIKLESKMWFNVVFKLSLPVGTCVVLCGIVFLSDTQPPLWAAAMYSAFDRTIVSICFSMFLLGCFVKCKSAMREALEWRGFHALGRLSYCAYLVHFIVLRLTLASNTTLGQASVFSMISLLITTSVYTYVISIPLCMLLELPAVQLYKAAVGTERPPPSTSQAKSLDVDTQHNGRMAC